ncbi:hypothetical protein [Streptomyces sp. CB03911]|uniref:hypothetical protein n=1 Tax=Streptomyces sp. CB03911 TaxID=1804758 RepID=UPI0009393B85|nr:hypothetical protein [Streptomyces sp. CB03911]OKI19312.1 hypothetical protein A6A07_07365 [Streptomyces sp. CB03911]
MSPDVLRVLALWLAARFDVRTCTELPASFETSLPIVQLASVGGSGARFSGSPRVDIDVYAATTDEARTLALQITDALKLLRGPLEPGAIVTDVRVDSLPSGRPYANPAVRRIGSTVTVSLHPAAH